MHLTVVFVVVNDVFDMFVVDAVVVWTRKVAEQKKLLSTLKKKTTCITEIKTLMKKKEKYNTIQTRILL